MNLDEELRAALRREEPSPGFARRVTVQAQSSAKASRSFPRMMWAAAMAALLVIGFSAMYEYRQADQQRKAERAGHDAVLALRITAAKLNSARERVIRREN
jgi:cytoskeletal protein RodZ